MTRTIERAWDAPLLDSPCARKIPRAVNVLDGVIRISGRELGIDHLTLPPTYARYDLDLEEQPSAVREVTPHRHTKIFPSNHPGRIDASDTSNVSLDIVYTCNALRSLTAWIVLNNLSPDCFMLTE